ncbi:hypothetical protein GQ600_21588 [Phytophthora cactorum]|nr:hypothetical protein GQ600_21588 [Phytophthora cactorum]
MSRRQASQDPDNGRTRTAIPDSGSDVSGVARASRTRKSVRKRTSSSTTGSQSKRRRRLQASRRHHSPSASSSDVETRRCSPSDSEDSEEEIPRTEGGGGTDGWDIVAQDNRLTVPELDVRAFDSWDSLETYLKP